MDSQRAALTETFAAICTLEGFLFAMYIPAGEREPEIGSRSRKKKKNPKLYHQTVTRQSFFTGIVSGSLIPSCIIGRDSRHSHIGKKKNQH